jgi:hypothetical protein
MCGEREKNRSEPRSEEEEEEEEDDELLARGARGGDVPITPLPVAD